MLRSDEAKPIRKLNSMGTDILVKMPNCHPLEMYGGIMPVVYLVALDLLILRY